SAKPEPATPPGETPPDATLTGTLSAIPAPGTPQPPDQQIQVEVNATPETSTLASVLNLGPALVGQVIFTLFLLFFLISSGDLLYLKIVQSFDSMREKRAAYLALREIEDSLGAYLGAITLINACLGLAIGLAMWAWGMPSPVLFGLAAFLLNFIPYLGSVTGIIIATLVGVFVFDDLFAPLMVGLTYLAITALEGQLITPYFVSRRLQLNTVVVFLTVALWAWLWSVIGMIVAVPLLVVMRVLAEHIPGLQKFGNFLAGEDPPALEDEDEEEARELVEAGDEAEDAARAATATMVLATKD
ncbi:AI-2E family transporter, partial [Paracoccus sp. PXZ]